MMYEKTVRDQNLGWKEFGRQILDIKRSWLTIIMYEKPTPTLIGRVKTMIKQHRALKKPLSTHNLVEKTIVIH